MVLHQFLVIFFFYFFLILSSFTYIQVVLNLYEFISSLGYNTHTHTISRMLVTKQFLFPID